MYRELVWVVPKKIQDQALAVLFDRGKTEFFTSERGFLGVIHPGSGIIRRSLILREVVPQENGWVATKDHGLSFDPKYFSRTIDALSDTPGAGLVIVHSHFGGSLNQRPEPSEPDLFHERRLLYQLSRALVPQSPLAAGILTRAGSWRIREYNWPRPKSEAEAKSKKFGIDTAFFADSYTTRIVSPTQDVKHLYGEKSTLSENQVDSTIRLWGKDGQRILSNLRVGIAGLGGVGSILTEFLSRLGIGELTLVDFDIVSEENLNRLVGARREDLGKPKVDYVTRMAKRAATATNFKVNSFRGSASEADGLRHLLDSDIIMNAADSAIARQVLDHASYAYFIPVIDGGTTLIVGTKGEETIGKSQVTASGPGRPCLECCGVYSQEEATLAREKPSMQGPRAYVQTEGTNIQEQKIRAPSVINYNGLVASLMIQRMLSIVLGLPPKDSQGQQRYYVEQGTLDWGPTIKCKDGCPKQSWIGLGDLHPVPIGIDPIWKEMREHQN